MKESYIEIVGLKVDTIIGVPEEERDSPQSVSIDLKFKPTNGLKNLGDNIEHTVDYYMCFRSEKTNRNFSRRYNWSAKKRF